VTRSIYVETTIDRPIDEIWEKSQDAALHERWDLRFSEIDYLPRSDGEPQRFRYASRLGGLVVDGTGESVGERRRPDGASSSSLRFWSDHPVAIIQEGAGFWRYVPTDQGTRFFTGYDYRVRWGWLGRVADALVFRPWIGWATAWSFDRLRLWLEKGQSPESSFAIWISFMAARFGLGLMWLYQGLVPKLIVADGEMALAEAAGIGSPELLVTAVGVAEIMFGVTFLIFSRWRWPYVATGVAMVPLTLVVLLTDGSSFGDPFNPLVLNLLAIALSFVGFPTSKLTPRAGNCLRVPPRDDNVDL
jgi:hypothetical protein